MTSCFYLSLAGCFSMDAIAESLFGIQIDSQDDYENEFVQNGRKAFEEFNFKNPLFFFPCTNILQYYCFFFIFAWYADKSDFSLCLVFAPFLAKIARRLGFDFGIVSQDSINFFNKKVKEILQLRKHANEVISVLSNYIIL